ncbi:MAG: hypothetical protein EOO71_07575 [Myxococcaceae bacterium]|nr:MAG: hypothetical protein EOO71_07575 [Myxococcaceae bacterium]
MKLDAHAQDKVDGEWARASTSSLWTGIGSLLESAPAPKRGHLLGVDCRTNTCLATLEFPDYGTAREQFPRFVEHAYDVPCGRTVMLDDPTDPSAPFKVKVLFEGCVRD